MLFLGQTRGTKIDSPGSQIELMKFVFLYLVILINYPRIDTLSFNHQKWALIKSYYGGKYWNGTFADDSGREIKVRVVFEKEESIAKSHFDHPLGKEFKKRVISIPSVDGAVWIEYLSPWLVSVCEPQDRPHTFAVKARAKSKLYWFSTEETNTPIGDFADEFFRKPRLLTEWRVICPIITLTIEDSVDSVYSKEVMIAQRDGEREYEKFRWKELPLPMRAKLGDEVIADFEIWAEFVEVNSDGIVQLGFKPLEDAEVELLEIVDAYREPREIVLKAKTNTHGRCRLTIGKIVTDLQIPFRIGWGRLDWRPPRRGECRPIMGYLKPRYGRKIEKYLDTFTYQRIAPPISYHYKDISNAILAHIKALYNPDNGGLAYTTTGNRAMESRHGTLHSGDAIIVARANSKLGDSLIAYLTQRAISSYCGLYERAKSGKSIRLPTFYGLDILIALSHREDKLWKDILVKIDKEYLGDCTKWSKKKWWDETDAIKCLQQWTIFELTRNQKIKQYAQKMIGELLALIDANFEPTYYLYREEKYYHDMASPHGIACLAFWKAYDITKERRYKNAALKQAKHILSKHYCDGKILAGKREQECSSKHFYAFETCKHALAQTYRETGDKSSKKASQAIEKFIFNLWREHFGGFRKIEGGFGKLQDSNLRDQFIVLRLYFPEFYPYWNWKD